MAGPTPAMVSRQTVSMLHALAYKPRVESENPPLLVLLHGLGSDENDLAPLGLELDPRLAVVSLRAPRAYEFGGYAWFDLTWDASGAHADEDRAVESLGLLLETLEHLPSTLGIQPSKMFLGGFSQGAMMSLRAGLATPERFAGILLFSGRLLPKLMPVQQEASIAQLPFLVQHGTQDQVVPVDGGRGIRAHLEALGATVEYHEYPMGHEINAQSFADAKNWMLRQLD